MTSVGVIPFRDVGTGETSVVLRADTDVRFWADFDGLYEPSYFAQYDVELIQGDRVVSTATCDPIVAHDRVRVCTMRGRFGGINKNHCRMRCRTRVPTSGPTLVRATFKTCCLMRNAVVYSANLTIQQ
jgi:hypothetical protein